MKTELSHLISVLRGRVPHHLLCNLRGCERHDMSHAEWEIFRTHKHLLCPCGGRLLSVHPALTTYRPGGVVR